MRLVDDPGGIYLRPALRAAVLVPALYAITGPTVGTTAALYGAFAAFSSLVFADFQGTARRRLEGHLALAILGGLLIALGSAVGDVPVAPAFALFLVTFAIRYAGCLGGYAVAAGTTLLLAFSLSVLTVPVTEVDQRLLGWVLGCVVAGLSTLVAPLPVRSLATERLAAQCRALATRLRTLGEAGEADRVDLTRVRSVREDLARSPGRPLDATASMTSLARLLDGASRATLICDNLPVGRPLADPGDATDLLVTAGAETFDDAALAIEQRRGVDLQLAQRALTEQRERMVALLGGEDPTARATAVDRAGAVMRLRFLTSLSAVVAATAASWRGNPPEGHVQIDAGAELPRRGAGPFWARARRTLASHLRWRSTRVRNSLRAGLALAASLVVARAIHFDHGFWVVLGTLMVLRSDVNDTATTALQALRGTLIGFGLAVGLAYLAGGEDTVLWVVLPFATFAAAWAPRAVGLGTGQAAFTVFVVTLFNLAVPEGTQTAVLRLATVATGIVVALVSGFVFWPRGPQADIGPAAARLYRCAAAVIRGVSADSLGLSTTGAELERDRRALAVARDQLEETLEELAAAHRSGVELADRVAVTTPPALVRAGDWANADLALGTVGRAEGAPQAPTPELEALAFEVSERFVAVAEQLEDPDLPSGPAPAPVVADPPSAEGLDGPQYLRQVWLWTWLTTLDHSLRATAPAGSSPCAAFPASGGGETKDHRGAR